MTTDITERAAGRVTSLCFIHYDSPVGTLTSWNIVCTSALVCCVHLIDLTVNNLCELYILYDIVYDIYDIVLG